MADYKLLSAVLADYADKAGTADSADTATSATTAETATKLSVGTVGSTSVPVYFSNGVPVEATGVSSGGLSYVSANRSQGTTTAEIVADIKYPMLWGSADTQGGQVRLLFIGWLSDGDQEGYMICGTFYNYGTATVVSGFWSPDEFDDCLDEYVTSSGAETTFSFTYLA